MGIVLDGRAVERALTMTEITGYRSVLGQLLWLGQRSRTDLCVGVSGCSETEQGDARQLLP